MTIPEPGASVASQAAKEQSPLAQSPAEILKPSFWPGLWLNVFLPGFGFTYLDRPWWHLAALVVTLAFWAGTWLGTIHLPLPQELVFLVPYVGVTVGYLQMYHVLSPSRPRMFRSAKILIFVAQLLPLLLIPIIFVLFFSNYRW